MDYSALSEAQLQQYYSSQQQQQQQQDPHYHQQAAYGQSYEAYYATYHHQNQQHDASQYHQQQYAASAYPHHQQYYYTAQDSSSYYQTVLTQPETMGVGPANPSQIHGYAASAAAPPQDQQHGPGLNPAAATAAVAALSQLSQFADTMDRAAAVADRHWHGKGGPPPSGPQHAHPGSRGRGRSSNRGGGRRGGGSFRDGGGGRGNFNHHPPREDGGEPSAFRGRGRGRGRGLTGRSRGRKSYQSASDLHSIRTPTATVGEQSLALEFQQAPTRPPPASVLQRRPILPVAWCDICRVDCNSLEILEQHKNGKRHKKTVQRVDEIQKQQRLFDELQAKVMPEMALQSTEADPAVQTKEVYKASSVVGITPNAAGLSAQVGNATKVSIAQEIMPSAVFSAVQVDGTNRATGASETAELTLKQDFELEAQKGHTAEGHAKVSKEKMATEASPSDAPLAEGSLTEGQPGHPKFGVYDRFDRRRGGLKRQMTRFGRGGKRLKTFESVRGRVPERPRDQPRVCTLCNVMCDTLAVFECHLSGKKHMSKIRRFQGQGSVYGPITVYIPPNQPSAYPTKGLDPLFYGLKCHEMLQLEASGDINALKVKNYGLQQHGDQSEQTRDAEIGGPHSQAMGKLDYPEGEVVAAEEDKEGLTLENIVEDPSLAPIALAYETNSEAEVPFTTGEYVIPLPEFGDHLGDDVRLPGLGAEVEGLGPNTEELLNEAEMSSK